ncbi:MAG TPA: ABC transporter permease subunit, partial [Pirellulales bacterium]
MSIAEPQNKTFTGRRRRRGTKRSVRIVDRMARALIAAGGIGAVVAVSTVCIFLVWVAAPLFFPASLGSEKSLAVDWPIGEALRVGTDEYQSLGWTVSADGALRTFRLDDGALLNEKQLFAAGAPTTWTFGPNGREAVCGFADGAVRSVQLEFSTTFPNPTDVPEETRKGTSSKPVPYENGLLARTSQGQLRLQTLEAKVTDVPAPADGAAVLLVDRSSPSSGPRVAVFSADNRLALYTQRRSASLSLKKSPATLATAALPYEQPNGRGRPRYLRLSGLGDNLYLIWEDGYLARYDLRDPQQPRIAEQLDLLPEENAKVTTVEFLPGKSTLAVGDTRGRVRAWFLSKPEDARTEDGATLVAAHEMDGPAAVTAIAPSARKRLIAVGYADGAVRVFHVTTAKELVATTLKGRMPGQTGGSSDTESAATSAARLVHLSPKDDTVAAVGGEGLSRWPFDARYPEVSLAALFTPQWYEGYDEPKNVWQSSGGSDDFEPKLGMLPLVFGTLKATIYSLLFAVPIALFSAVYTSEFLHPSSRARIKPVIEMMASLPSVVLGFVAALVIAPFVESVIPAVLAAIMVLPLTLLIAAHLWQLLPQRASLILARWRFVFIFATLPVGVLLSMAVGPVVERTLFAGDLRSWLDNQAGSGIGGWIVMLLPMSALAVAIVVSRRVNPVLRSRLRGANRARWAVVELLKFVIATGVTLAGAVVVGWLLDSLHLDPRGMVLGTYMQRNALVVGFVMGFAVIPIIYTVADDALATVPAHLRSASLGAGATPWQTAVRVIVPTAMSGLFSAVMIGLGRAVGETMIVLMAAGNTPIIDWNIFNGFQTLSANIATELPEAVQGSAHYRTLFVAALALFAITFVVNTI